MQTPDQIIARARREFATSGAPWTDRTGPSILNVVAPFVMDLQHRTLAPEVVKSIRVSLESSGVADKIETLAALALVYDDAGSPL